jgi:hypothetical protein
MDRFRLVAAWILQFLLAAFFAIQAIVKLGGSQACDYPISRVGIP